MNKKPTAEEMFFRLIDAIADEESSSDEKIRESLREEGLDPDETIKMWNNNFKKKLAEYRASKNK